MPNDQLIHSVRNGGAWALGNCAAEYQHYFMQAPAVGNSAISACWARVARLDNLAPCDNKPKCPECESMLTLRKVGAYRTRLD